jgi:PTH1 family peptidyl-tRNA hydrolase
MLVIAGLGNPEPRYARNRHNIGFEVVQAFAEVVKPMCCSFDP